MAKISSVRTGTSITQTLSSDIGWFSGSRELFTALPFSVLRAPGSLLLFQSTCKQMGGTGVVFCWARTQVGERGTHSTKLTRPLLGCGQDKMRQAVTLHGIIATTKMQKF